MSNKKNLANINETRSESTDDKFCTLKFSMCDSKYPMHELNSNEIKEFVSFAKKIEKIQWKNIKQVPGLRYEVLHNFSKPDSISKDVTIRSMRLSQKFRVIGYREGEYFYIVWFDNKHETC